VQEVKHEILDSVALHEYRVLSLHYINILLIVVN